MACEEMREWEKVREQVEELIALNLPATPPKEDLLEEIHEESHRLIDLQEMVSGKPHLKKGAMAPLLTEAARRVLDKYRATTARSAETVSVATTRSHSGSR